MRLSDEKARQLTAMVWRDRLRRLLPIGVALIVLIVAFTYYFGSQLARVDRTVEVRERGATVVSIKRGGSSRASIVQVHLDDGKDVDAFATFRVMPAAGTHVVVAEARHASGRVTYDIVRLVDQ